jgi:hypothetical protein
LPFDVYLSQFSAPSAWWRRGSSAVDPHVLVADALADQRRRALLHALLRDMFGPHRRPSEPVLATHADATAGTPPAPNHAYPAATRTT